MSLRSGFQSLFVTATGTRFVHTSWAMPPWLGFVHQFLQLAIEKDKNGYTMSFLMTMMRRSLTTHGEGEGGNGDNEGSDTWRNDAGGNIVVDDDSNKDDDDNGIDYDEWRRGSNGKDKDELTNMMGSRWQLAEVTPMVSTVRNNQQDW